MLSDNSQGNMSEISDIMGEKQGSQQIWAIGGGKGGVGKSLVTSNLAICLSLLGMKVVIIDMDLGGANIHTCLGVPIPDKTLSDYFSKSSTKLSDLITPTPLNNLFLISGAQDELGIANLRNIQKNKIISQLRELDADYILLDLGAGTTHNTLDFFLSADQGILVTLPEPTSIENTYRFIKSVFYRKLSQLDDFLELSPIIDKALNSKISENHSPSEIVAKAREINPMIADKLEREISEFSPKLIINQARTQADIDIGFSMKIISKKYFGINLDYVGYLEYDATVWQSVKRKKPLILEFPSSALVKNFENIIHRVLNLTKK
ncbi:MAG: ATP-binding protein [Halobacteriovorax sp.]|nr:ATP-binding protein [Halobacteriovorax sp.]|tara:strand:+ start:2698 stop:3660 length:963 start_codon:yes stop_codon:yes gene_type:complete